MSHAHLDEWIDLAAVATAVPMSRHYVALLVEKWEIPSLRDDALLVVSELVTNAVRATGIPDHHPTWQELQQVNLITVRLIGLETQPGSGVPRTVVIQVWDSEPGRPVLRPTDPDALTGRGLHLVNAIATRWGSFPTPTGKAVWAELTVNRTTGNELETLPSPRAAPNPASETRPHDRRPMIAETDPEVLRRVLEGLRALDGDPSDPTHRRSCCE